MFPSWENYFGKITKWSFIYFLNYSLISYLAQSQILVISFYIAVVNVYIVPKNSIAVLAIL